MIELILGAAAIPIVITACVGIICCVIVGTVCYYVGRYNHDAETREQKRLKEELRTREKEVRQSASKLAEQTAQDAKELREQGKEQRKHIQESTKKLDTKVVQIETTAKRLEKTSSDLKSTAHRAQEKVSDVTSELTQLKSQITTINLELKSTKDSLIEKEAALQEVVTLLGETQRSLQENTHKSKAEIDALTRQLSEAQELVRGALVGKDSIREVEILHLRTDNERLASSVQKLETTVNSYKTEFLTLSRTNKRQLDEITALHNENKQLTRTITLLSDALETGKASAKEPTSSSIRGIKLFNS